MKIDSDMYLQIADALRQDLPEKWIKALFQVELEEYSGRAAGFYQVAKEPACHHLDIQADVISLFKELQRSMTLRQTQAWNSATYILHADGHFDIYFEYFDFALSNVLDRRKAWREKHHCN